MTNDEESSNAQMTNLGSTTLFSVLGRRHSFVIRHSTFIICSLFALAIYGEPLPSAQDVLASVRMQQSMQRLDLQGQLREDNLVIPFRLSQTGPVIRYAFENPEEVLQLRLGENSSRLDVVSDTATKRVPASKLNQKIRGTAVTYVDLALKFLYWPDGAVLGEETVRTRRCWKLQLRAPSRESQYSNVLLWVDEASGALMRLDCYDWNGQLVKRFEVVSGQKIDNRWFLKQMRIEELQPGTNNVVGRTYLEIKK
ncbi:MAG: outer membrane lipoprotein-sorting protein [Chthoniobacterales bacterium]